MRVLFSHTNYPAQFRRLLPYLSAKGHELVFLCKKKEWHSNPVQGIRLLPYQPHRTSQPEYIHPYLRRFEDSVLEGQAAFRAAMQLREEGWTPDAIVSHIGFGSGLYLSDLFPSARRIGLIEWFYNSLGSDVEFIRKGEIEYDRMLRLRTWNAQSLVEASCCHELITPTRWQWQQFPDHLRPAIRILHEGIDWSHLSRIREQPPPLPNGLAIPQGAPLVTYVSRGFEEYRGFPQAMIAFDLLQKENPEVHVAIAGSDVVAYGATRSDGRSWKEWAVQELSLDPQRTHWLGPLQEPDYQALLANSSAHLYLTIPFVLSWSLLEAMAVGVPIVASATAPVREVLVHGETALLSDFWSPESHCSRLVELIDHPATGASLGKAASRAAEIYRCESSLAAWESLLLGHPHDWDRPLAVTAPIAL